MSGDIVAAGRPPHRDRIAELTVTTADGRRRGSGYRVTANAVLTAAHVLAGAKRVHVRFEPDLPRQWTATTLDWWVDSDSDVAVVSIEPRPDEARVDPVQFGRIEERAVVLTAQAVGFPRWKMRTDSEARYRDAHHAVGTVPVLSNWREGTLEFLVASPPAAADPGISPWEGMSGAPLWVDGRIVGVLAEHHPSEGLARLAAARLDLALARLDGRRGAEARALLAIPEQLPDASWAYASAMPVVSNLPPRNPNFTARTEHLDRLRQLTGATALVDAQVLYGLGGVGKTQLVLEYAHRHQADYDCVWWVTADEPAAIAGQLAALAQALGVATPEEPVTTAVQTLWDTLRRTNRWLLVFDNAEKPEHLRPWWPPDSGTVLVTSRNPGWAGLAAPLTVDVLAPEEAAEFLRRRLLRDDPAFAQLAEVLGYLPLALEQAAAYLEEAVVEVDDYLTLLGEGDLDLLRLGRSVTSERTVATTWNVSFERIRTELPGAEDVLILLAFLAPENVPRDLLARHVSLLPARLRATVAERVSYQRAAAMLRRYSLITVTEDSFSMHRLVQTVVRQSLSEQRRRAWAKTALDLVHSAFPSDKAPADKLVTNPANWPDCARLLPTLLTVTRFSEQLGVSSPRAADLMHRAAIYLHWNADLSAALDLLGRALVISEARRLGSYRRHTIALLSAIADVMRDQRDLTGARRMLERARRIHRIRVDTVLDSDRLYVLASLGGLVAMQGVARERDKGLARRLLTRALRAYRRRLLLVPEAGIRNDAAYCHHHLAIVLAGQGSFSQAREHWQRARELWAAVQGAEYPAIAYSLAAEASALELIAGHDEASSLRHRALRIFEAGLGPDHPATRELQKQIEQS